MLKTVTLVLHGHYEGKTVNLKGTKFIDGKVTLKGSEKDVDNLSMYLRKNWQAYPEGVLPEYKQEAQNGPSKNDQSSGDGESGELGGNAGGEAGSEPEEVSSSLESGDDGDDSGESGHLSSGDGHEDARVSQTPTKLEDSSSSTVNGEALLEAMEQLDPANLEHWNQMGKPRVNVVEKFYGKAGLTRRDLDAVWPELTKDTAARKPRPVT